MQEETKTFQDYIQPFLRQKWLILACVIVVTIPTLIVLVTSRHMYKATATILIEQEKLRVLDVEDVVSSDLSSKDYFETQVMMMASPSIARRVIQDLHLDQSPDFAPEPDDGSFRFNIRQALASVINSVVQEIGPEREGLHQDEISDSLFPTLETYLTRLKIDPLKTSRLVNISFETYDPALAAKVANAHAEAYIEKYMSLRLSASKEATRWLQSQLEEAQQKVSESEDALQSFTEKENILTLPDLSGSERKGDEENVVLNNLAALNRNLAEARTERIGLETLWHQIEALAKTPGLEESIPEISENKLIQELKMRLSELNREYVELSKKYGERHPRMVAIQEEVQGLRGRIATEVRKIAKGVEVQLEVARARENNLIDELDRVKQAGMSLNKKAVQFMALKQEVDSNRQIAEMLLNRAKETSLASGLSSSNLFVVDHAGIPQVPSKPKKKLMLVMALFAGLSLGMGLTLFLEHLDTSFHGPDEVKKYLSVPFLGPVGYLGKIDKETGSELEVIRDPRSHFSECLRNVATNIIFSLPEANQKTLVITSANPFEGKTLIGSNLAVLLAEMGRKVLLIDADMRVPRVHQIFKIPLDPGLSNLVFRTCPLEDPIRDSQVNLLRVLPAGTLPPNPVAILSSSGMKWLLDQFKKNFDLILFDTPPILSAADASLLGGAVDGVVLVMRAASTKREIAKRALEQMNHVRARVLGTILNQVDFKREHYYYSYYSHYNYYYTPEGRKKYRRRGGQDQKQG
jgi:succinoglycan biosynthesis transport protein ExoP